MNCTNTYATNIHSTWWKLEQLLPLLFRACSVSFRLTDQIAVNFRLSLTPCTQVSIYIITINEKRTRLYNTYLRKSILQSCENPIYFILFDFHGASGKLVVIFAIWGDGLSKCEQNGYVLNYRTHKFILFKSLHGKLGIATWNRILLVQTLFLLLLYSIIACVFCVRHETIVLRLVAMSSMAIHDFSESLRKEAWIIIIIITDKYKQNAVNGALLMFC